MDMIAKKIKITDILHYFIIYLFLLIPSSNLYTHFFNSYIKILLTIILFTPIILKKKYRSPYILLFIFIIFLSTVFTKLLNNGAGLNSLVESFNCILIINIAYNFNREKFVVRFCKLSVILAVISLFCFSISHIDGFFDKLPLPKYLSFITGSGSYQKYFYSKGLFIYSFNEYHLDRNCGLFTEPGKYQIHLNTIVLILLFYKNLDIKKSIKIFWLIIITLTIITSLSTTGYIGLFANIVFYLLFFKVEKNKNIKGLVIFGSLSLLFLLLFDYVFRMENSFINIAILSKLFENGNLNLSVNTGYYRMGTIINCLKITFNNPFGVGYANLDKMIYSNTGFAGASIIKYMAIYGIFSWIIVMVIIFYPIFINKKISLSIKVLFTLLFLNTTLAQTHLFYPSLIMIPMIIAISERKNNIYEDFNTSS